MARAVSQKKVTRVNQAGGASFRQNKYFKDWLVFGLAFILYASIIGGGYNMDDELVTINHRLTSKGISALPEIFSSPYYQDNQGYAYEYRPLVLATFAIEHQFFGDNAQVSHFLNVLLYALCCLVLFRVLRKLFKNYSPLLAMAITLLFIVHPVHTEVVCSIKNRDEMLGLIFALLTLHVCLIGLQTGKKWWFVLAPVLFTLALLGKITVISFMVIIPVALILFTDAGWILIALLEISFFIPVYVLLNIESGSNKQLMLVGVLILVLAFYAIMNFSSFRVGLVSALKNLRSALLTNEPVSQIIDPANKIYAPNELLKGIDLRRHLLKFFPLLLTGLLAIGYLALIATYHSSFAIVPIALLILLAWFGAESMQWWAMVMLGICVSSCLGTTRDTTGQGMLNLYCKLVGLYLAFQIYYGKRDLFIPTALLYIWFNFRSVYYCNNYDSLFFPLVIFFNHRYIRYAAFAMLAIWSRDLLPFKNTYDSFDLIGNLCGIALLASVQLKKGLRFVPWVILIAASLWLHYNLRSDNQTIGVNRTVSAIKAASDQVNPKIIAAPQYRPLNFIEECVDFTSPTTLRVGTSLEILFHYLAKAVVPYPLSYYYGYKYITPQKITDTLPLLSLALHMLLLFVALFFLKKEPLVSFGLLVYLLSIVVFSNYLQPVPGMIADRFLLIPSLGWSIVLVVIIQKIFAPVAGVGMISWQAVPVRGRYIFATAMLLYGVMTFSRSLDWYSDLKLMRHDIEVVPESVQAHNVLGIHLVKASLTVQDPNQQLQLRNEALANIKMANTLYPGYFNFTFDIGRIYALLNMPDSALIYFKQAMPLNTEYPDVPINIATIFLGRNQFDSAIVYFNVAIKESPNDPTLYDRLSYAYFKSNYFDASIQTNQSAIKLVPNRPDPYINIATCYLKRTDGFVHGADSARVWLDKGLAANPGNLAITEYIRKLK